MLIIWNTISGRSSSAMVISQ